VRLTLFHPYLRALGNKVEESLAANQRSATLTVRLRPPPAMSMTDY
jgi:hypothetical protein